MDNAAGSLTAASFGHHQEQQQRNMLVLKPCKIQAVPMHAHVPATKRKGMEEKVSHIASPCPSLQQPTTKNCSAADAAVAASSTPDAAATHATAATYLCHQIFRM
jgi:hypothetical protein